MKIIAFILSVFLLATTAQAAQRNLMVATGDTQIQKRVALVIGNAAYLGAPELRNPVNDARAISDALNRLGFEVIEVTDASQREMNRAITRFGKKLDGETVALFFYAGHGLQVKGKNYIIPVDALIETESAVASESVSVDTILVQLNISPVSIVILDACRNNPFERSFRKIGGGLAQMDAPKGSFIAYATAPGMTAADGDGKNGLFTQELLKQINEPGLTLESVFKRVRSNVSAKSGDAQMPWDSSSMTGDFYFKPVSAGQTASQQFVPARIKSHDEIEQDAWESAHDSNNASAILEYLKQYPKGRFVGQARVMIAALKTEAMKLESPAAATPAGVDDETALWAEVQKGNSREEYKAYLGQYPKGKYAVLAKVKLNKLAEEVAEQARIEREVAAQRAAQQEQSTWESANSAASEVSYQRYLNSYPQGRFSMLARARIARLVAASAQSAAAAEEANLRAAEEEAQKHMQEAARNEQENRRRYEQLVAEGDAGLKASDKKTALARYGAALELVPGSTELTSRIEQARMLVGAGDTFRDPLKDGSDGPEMVVLPAGSFQMGSATGPTRNFYEATVPVHEVTFKKPFAMGKYEITFEEFDKFTRATRRPLLSDHGWGRGRRPATKIVWADAMAYVRWLSEQTGKHYRIPTEAEWEYAARAGTRTSYWWGDQPSHEYANYGDGQPGWFPSGVVSGRDQWMHTAPVGQFPANPFGLFDMQGNVWEWVTDCWHESYAGAPADGTAYGDTACSNRVMRGGSWGYNPDFMRAETRVKVFWGVLSFLYYGIRVARDID
ncbi:MAG: SUMF1/EgtB/PvdO family nonheme iron enzyme [Gallionella sp.]|jgi:formylglycine-generating enzyme required for sulfatase activity